jgi:hypothetical protein
MNENMVSGDAGSIHRPPGSGPQPAERNWSFGRRALFYVAGIAFIFLLGFLPMWLKAISLEKQDAATRRDLRLARVELALASAAIDARRADYEPARLSAIDFFTGITAEMQPGADSALTAAQSESLKPLLAQRDDLITLLARSDPASAGRLSDLYVAFRKTLGD